MLSVLINTHMLMAAHKHGVERFFYSSSACIYPGSQADRRRRDGLKESDAYPADCEDGYGWEKLFSERMCRHFREDFGIKTRVARYHNVYGPYGTWDGGREKAPAAVSRKVAMAVHQSGKHEIEIWGDGEQTRSFMYIDDCLMGTQKLLHSDVDGAAQCRQRRDGDDQPACRYRGDRLPGSSSSATTSSMRRRACAAATATIRLIKAKLGWAPNIPLSDGHGADLSLDLRSGQGAGGRTAVHCGGRVSARA